MDEGNIFMSGGGSKFQQFLAAMTNNERQNALLKGQNAGMIGAMGFQSNPQGQGQAPAAPPSAALANEGSGDDPVPSFGQQVQQYKKNQLIDSVVSKDNEKMIGMTQQAGALNQVLQQMPPQAQKLLDKFQQGDLGINDNITLNGFLNAALKTHEAMTGQDIEGAKYQKAVLAMSVAQQNQAAWTKAAKSGVDMSDPSAIIPAFVNAGGQVTPDVEPFLRTAMGASAREKAAEAANERLQDRLNSQKGSFDSADEAIAALGNHPGKVVSKPGKTYDIEFDNSAAIGAQAGAYQNLDAAKKALGESGGKVIPRANGTYDVQLQNAPALNLGPLGSGSAGAAPAAQGGVVKIKTPSGQIGTIPAANLQQAIQAGAVQVQ